MPIPTLEPGLVISYAYLWHTEHEAGHEEGRKDRPSVIVLAVERQADDSMVVTLLPITHTAPVDPASAVEIPAAVKRHLGLDDDPRMGGPKTEHSRRFCVRSGSVVAGVGFEPTTFRL